VQVGGHNVEMCSTLSYASVSEAQEQVAAHIRPGPVTRVPLGEALGRVTAEAIVCDMDYPPFAKAMMDGYAVRAEGAAEGGSLKVVGQVAAGGAAREPLGAGEAVQINTGAPVPEGADAVVPVERTECADSGQVHIRAKVTRGQHVEPRAAYVRAGAAVIGARTRLRPSHIAVAAAAGAAEIPVYRKPRVAILVTGDELVDVSRVPQGSEIRNGNGPMMAALVREAHAAPIELGVVGDDKRLLDRAIRQGLKADLLCISGGVSMGAFDFVPEVLADCGVRTLVRKIRLKPGKPTTIGVADSGTGVFALVGNPIGCFVGFRLFVCMAIEALEGRAGMRARLITARLEGRCPPTSERETYLPARAGIDARGELLAEPLSWHGSGDPFGFSDADALIVRRPGAGVAEIGDAVSIILLGEQRG
jgi:molybdopterin molybdotransferase